MNHAEWIAVCNEALELWGPSKRWSEAKGNANREVAQDYQRPVASAALRDMHAEGRAHPPSTSELFARTRANGGQAFDTTGRGPCTHPAVAILEYHPDGTGSVGLCATCRHAFEWTRGEQWSVGAVEERRARNDAELAQVAP